MFIQKIPPSCCWDLSIIKCSSNTSGCDTIWWSPTTRNIRQTGVPLVSPTNLMLPSRSINQNAALSFYPRTYVIFPTVNECGFKCFWIFYNERYYPLYAKQFDLPASGFEKSRRVVMVYWKTRLLRWHGKLSALMNMAMTAFWRGAPYR